MKAALPTFLSVNMEMPGNTPGGLEPSLLLRESKPSLLVLCDDVNPFSGFKGGGDGHGWANDGFWSGVKR